MREKVINGAKRILKSILIILMGSNSIVVKRKKRKHLLKNLSLCSIFLISCSNIHYKGELKVNNRGAINEMVIFANLTDNVIIKSKISQPYTIQKMYLDLPEYTETSLEIKF